MEYPRRRQLVIAAFGVATVATLGSLYYSEGMGLFPCELCWYQRVAMYPLVVVLGYAAVTDMADVYWLALPFSSVGLVTSSYHSYLQANPASQCRFGGCATVQFELGGFLTIPNQAAIAFAVITALLLVVWYGTRKTEATA